jgi:hypothetical protein
MSAFEQLKDRLIEAAAWEDLPNTAGYPTNDPDVKEALTLLKGEIKVLAGQCSFTPDDEDVEDWIKPYRETR